MLSKFPPAFNRATHVGAPVIAETVVTGTVIDITQPLSAKTITADTSCTFSGTTTGAEFRTVFRNTDVADHTVTLPSAYSEARGANITEYLVPAGESLTLGFRREASQWVVYGDPVSDAPPEMEDADVTAGTGTTPKTPSAAQLKLAVETHGVVIPNGFYGLWETANIGSLPAGFFAADGTEGTQNLTAAAPANMTYVKRTPGLAPTIVSATVLASGTTLEIVFSKAVTGDGAGFALNMSGGAATLSAPSGSGTATWQWTISRTVINTETGTFDYSAAVGNMAAVNNSMDLADVTAGAVTNNSTQVALDLLSNLVSYWSMEGAAGAGETDQHGAYDLTHNNISQDIQSVAGIISNGRSNPSNSGFFSLADIADFRPGSSPFFMTLWARVNNLSQATFPGIFSKAATDSTVEWSLLWGNTNKEPILSVSANGSTKTEIGGGTNSFPDTSTWIFIAAGWDGTDIKLSINGGAFITAAFAGPIYNGSAAVKILGRNTSTVAWSGRVDEVAFWKGRALTLSEVQAIYNGGAGLPYSSW